MRAVAERLSSFRAARSPLLVAMLLLILLGWAQLTTLSGRAAFVSASDFGFAASNVATGQPFDRSPLFPNVVLTPGVAVEAAVEVRNTGRVPIAVHLQAVSGRSASAAAPSGEDGSGLQIEVIRPGGAVAFRGPMRALDALVANTLGPAENTTALIRVWLDASADARSMGQSMGANFSISVNQVG